ncbi:MAG: hypothetical protein QOI64_1378 [Solirubrobacteraceae bacterium]|jgi:uncharacterized membrane protein YcaP (DUF421 family)|nr:hypothetical protein [Solirubrobacteraceae bacterium]
MDVALRAIVIFGLVLLVTRVVGRRELSSMEPFDLILLVVVGDLIQQGVTQSDYSLTGTLIVLSVIATMTVLTSYVSFRFPRARATLEGEPIVLVERGQIIERNLRRERMTHDELAAEARLAQIADLHAVHLAVLETSGRISFVTEEPKGVVAGSDG